MRNNKKNIGSFDTAIEYPDSNEISSNSVKVVIYTKQHVISYAIKSEHQFASPGMSVHLNNFL